MSTQNVNSFEGLDLYPVNWKPFIPLLKQTKSPHFSEKIKIDLPGQEARTHSVVSHGTPISEQFLPVKAGGGLVQLRDLFLNPVPQDTLHADQLDQLL